MLAESGHAGETHGRAGFPASGGTLWPSRLSSERRAIGTDAKRDYWPCGMRIPESMSCDLTKSAMALASPSERRTVIVASRRRGAGRVVLLPCGLLLAEESGLPLPSRSPHWQPLLPAAAPPRWLLHRCTAPPSHQQRRTRRRRCAWRHPRRRLHPRPGAARLALGAAAPCRSRCRPRRRRRRRPLPRKHSPTARVMTPPPARRARCGRSIRGSAPPSARCRAPCRRHVRRLPRRRRPPPPPPPWPALPAAVPGDPSPASSLHRRDLAEARRRAPGSVGSRSPSRCRGRPPPTPLIDDGSDGRRAGAERSAHATPSACSASATAAAASAASCFTSS